MPHEPHPLRVAIGAPKAELPRIEKVLTEHGEFEVVGQAIGPQELERIFSMDGENVDVLVTDIQLSGEDVIPSLERIHAQHPDVDILVYTLHSNESSVIRAILAGATGYILKGDIGDISTSIRLIRGGGSPVSPTVARSVLRAIHSKTIQPRVKTPRVPQAANKRTLLSDRETEILILMGKGIAFADIGKILAISPHTVTAHIKKIYRKLQVHSRGEAVYEASCMGILQQRLR